MSTDERMTASLAEFMNGARRLEIRLEAVLSVPAFLLNVYSILKLRQLDALFPSLRIVMTTACAATALFSLLHPLQHLIPPPDYAVANGRYVEASLYYVSCFVSHVCFVMFYCKYLLIAIERHYAYVHRKTFEAEGRAVGFKISVFYVLISVLISVVKIVVYLFDDKEETIDGRLHRAFFVEGPAFFFIASYIMATIAWSFGAWQIHKFTLLAERMRFEGRSLSESLTIKNTCAVLRFLKPLSYVFFVGMVVSGCCAAFIVLVLRDGFDEHSPAYKAASNSIYLAVACYNLFASLYNILYFRPLNRLLRRDLRRIFGFDPNGQRAACAPQQSAAEIQQQHFETLEILWARTQPRPRSV